MYNPPMLYTSVWLLLPRAWIDLAKHPESGEYNIINKMLKSFGNLRWIPLKQLSAIFTWAYYG